MTSGYEQSASEIDPASSRMFATETLIEGKGERDQSNAITRDHDNAESMQSCVNRKKGRRSVNSIAIILDSIDDHLLPVAEFVACLQIGTDLLVFGIRDFHVVLGCQNGDPARLAQRATILQLMLP